MEELDFNNITEDNFKILQEQDQTEQIEPEQVEQQQTEQQPESQQQEEIRDEKPVQSDYKFKDDFIKDLVDYYEKTGDIIPYLEAKTVDYNQIPDEEIMRRNLREQYSDLSDKAFDRLYKQQVLDRFKLDADEWGEDDSELGRELLKSEADKIRNQYIDWQKKFKAPEPVNSNQDYSKEFEKMVLQDEFTNRVVESKKLTIKTPDGEFNYEIPEATSLVKMTVDNDKFFQQFADGKGGIDYARWYKTAAYSQNPEQFERSLINYGKTLGRSEVTKELKNPSQPLGGRVPSDSSSDFKSGLLEAFASRGVHK
jgi:hypothetical protein